MTGFGDEWIKFGATSEHTVDGSFSERTMALSTPYPGVQPAYRGNVTETQDDLNAWVERVHRAGIQVNCHANGDVAIDMFLTAVERAQKLLSAGRRASQDHALHADQRRPRAPDQGAGRGAGDVHDVRLLQQRQVRVLWRGADEAVHGVSHACSTPASAAAAGSDFAPGPFAPLMGIQGMVTRTGWDGKTWGANQRISVDEALAREHDQRRVRLA